MSGEICPSPRPERCRRPLRTGASLPCRLRRMYWRTCSSCRHLCQFVERLLVFLFVGRAVVPDRHMLHVRHALALDRFADHEKRPLAAAAGYCAEYLRGAMTVDFDALPAEPAPL